MAHSGEVNRPCSRTTPGGTPDAGGCVVPVGACRGGWSRAVAGDQAVGTPGDAGDEGWSSKAGLGNDHTAEQGGTTPWGTDLAPMMGLVPLQGGAIPVTLAYEGVGVSGLSLGRQRVTWQRPVLHTAVVRTTCQ